MSFQENNNIQIKEKSNQDTIDASDHFQEYYNTHYQDPKGSYVNIQQSLHQIQEDEKQSSSLSYEDLSSKLAKALTKVQAKSTSNKSQSFFNRVNYYEKKKTINLQKKKQQKETQQNTMLNKKPKLMNMHSQKILSQYIPIQQRSENIIQEKNKKIEDQRKAKQIKQQEQNIQVKQEANKTEFTQNKLQQFLQKMNFWKIKKDSKIAEEMNKQAIKQMIGVTFTPEINAKSKHIISAKGYERIQERLVKPKPILPGSHCTFKPNLNKTKK